MEDSCFTNDSVTYLVNTFNNYEIIKNCMPSLAHYHYTGSDFDTVCICLTNSNINMKQAY